MTILAESVANDLCIDGRETAVSCLGLQKTVDGRFSVQATISLTRDQWRELAREHGVRGVCCLSGIDDAQLSDFVLHQVFEAFIAAAETSAAASGSNAELPAKAVR